MSPRLEGHKNLRSVPLLVGDASRGTLSYPWQAKRTSLPHTFALFSTAPHRIAGKNQRYVSKCWFFNSHSSEPQPPQAVVVRWVGAARCTESFKAAGGQPGISRQPQGLPQCVPGKRPYHCEPSRFAIHLLFTRTCIHKALVPAVVFWCLQIVGHWSKDRETQLFFSSFLFFPPPPKTQKGQIWN